MNRITLFFLFAATCALTLSGCQAIGDIFKAGIWVGIIVVVVILVIILLIARAFKK